MAGESWTFSHQQYVQQARVVANQALLLKHAISDLKAFKDSNGVAGAAITDGEVQSIGPSYQQLSAALVQDAYTDLLSLLAVMDDTATQHLANMICGLPQ